jgi:glutaredoxin
MDMVTTARPRATFYRMVMNKHVCPYGVKAKHLLRRQGYEVEDHWLTSRAETDAFKADHEVKTTPQAFIDGRRIGGYDDLRRHFGKAIRDPKATSYRPVIAIFAMTALMALAASYAASGTPAHRPRWRVVHRLQHVCARAPQAARHRELLLHVSRL